MRSLEEHEVGKCTFIRGDDGNDVFVQFGGEHVDDAGRIKSITR